MAFTNLAESVPYYIGNQFEILASNLIREYDYIFYISPEGVPLEDNGVRTTDMEYRKKIDKEIQRILKERAPNHIQLSGTTEERIKKIKETLPF